MIFMIASSNSPMTVLDPSFRRCGEGEPRRGRHCTAAGGNGKGNGGMERKTRRHQLICPPPPAPWHRCHWSWQGRPSNRLPSFVAAGKDRPTSLPSKMWPALPMAQTNEQADRVAHLCQPAHRMCRNTCGGLAIQRGQAPSGASLCRCTNRAVVPPWGWTRPTRS